MNGPILMSKENPDGAKLEEILDLLCQEIEGKSSKLKNEKTSLVVKPGEEEKAKIAPASDKVRDMIVRNNDRIVSYLRSAIRTQESTMKIIEKFYGPDKGPVNPRL